MTNTDVQWVWRPIRGKPGWKAHLPVDWAKRHGEAIAEFWTRVKHGERRLVLLQEFADRIVPRLQRYSEIRKQRARRASGGTCWACAKARTLVVHHIIQVQHGGRNVKRNTVCVCHVCHVAIHPWMAKGGATVAHQRRPDVAVPTYVAPTFDPTPRLKR